MKKAITTRNATSATEHNGFAPIATDAQVNGAASARLNGTASPRLYGAVSTRVNAAASTSVNAATSTRVNGAASTSVNRSASTVLAPSRPAQIPRPQSASQAYKLTEDENAKFLHLISACAQIRTHYELFLLAQGELQYFLPHDILIAAWGDFSARNPQFDVISNLPEVRTNRVCDSVVPLAIRLHQIWIDGGSQPIQSNKQVADVHVCRNDACALPCAFPDMVLALVHGTHNKRDGYDSLYISLRRNPFSVNGAEARLRYLADPVIHQIDVAYRKVAALHSTNAPSKEHRLSILLSSREEEITHWVCQGKTNGQIAQILGISVNTVKNHVHRIFDKLGANNRTEAVVKYRKMIAAKPDPGNTKRERRSVERRLSAVTVSQ